MITKQSHEIQPQMNDQLTTIKLKHASTQQEIEVQCNLKNSVSNLVDDVRSKLNLSLLSNVRLIFCGKLLAPPSSLLETFSLKEGSFIHVVVNENKSTVAIVANVSISPPTAPQGPLLGLDILLGGPLVITSRGARIGTTGPGLSVDAVAAIRSAFRQSIDEFILQSGIVIAPDEDNVAFRNRCETVWFQAQGPTSEFALNMVVLGSLNGLRSPALNNDAWALIQGQGRGPALGVGTGAGQVVDDPQSLGTYNDFIWGLAFGMFFGFMMVFCVWDRNVSYRQKQGIMLGIVLQSISGIIESYITASNSGGGVTAPSPVSVPALPSSLSSSSTSPLPAGPGLVPS